MEKSPESATKRQRRTRKVKLPSPEEEKLLLQATIRRSELEYNSSVTLSSVDSATRFFAALEQAPTITTSIEEFNDPIELFERLNPLGLQYGGVKLCPPSGWKPPFCLDLETFKFKARKQLVHKLASGNNGFKFPKAFWTFENFAMYNDRFKAKYLDAKRAETSRRTDEKIQQLDDQSLLEWEVDYWRLLESQSPPGGSIFYGADIEVSEVGSGFPQSSAAATSSVTIRDDDHHLDSRSPPTDFTTITATTATTPEPVSATTVLVSTENGSSAKPVVLHDLLPNTPASSSSLTSFDYYAAHPWNLLNLSEIQGSLLRSFPKVVPGVTCPWLYVGMLFSSFCWHTEDNYFASVNYQHLGKEKVWYIIPPSQQPQMEKFMKDYLAHKKPEDILHSLTVQLSPSLLSMNGIKIYRIVQQPNEFILLWPRAFHCGFNTGFNCNEACNVAPPIWLDWGHLAVSSYRYLRALCIPYEQLIHLASTNCGNMKTETIEKLIIALSRIILDDYRNRRRASLNIKQAPLIPSRCLLKLLPAFYPASTKKRATSMFKLRSVKDRAALREWFISVCTKSIHLYDSNDDEFLQQFKAVACLPYLDCDRCKLPTYQGFVSCPHTMDCLCLSCIHPKHDLACHCSSVTLVYRFPLSVQLRLLGLLQQRVGESSMWSFKGEEETEGESCSYLEEDTKFIHPDDCVAASMLEGNKETVSEREQQTSCTSAEMNGGVQCFKVPSRRAVELLEASRASPIQLGHVGPFVWQTSSSSSPLQSTTSNGENEVLMHRQTTATVVLPGGPETKRPRGRPRLSISGNAVNCVPLDLDDSATLHQPLTQKQFEVWSGMRVDSTAVRPIRLPAYNYDMNKLGVNDVLCRLASKHLMAGLEIELNESDTSDSETDTEEEGAEDQMKKTKRRGGNNEGKRSITQSSSRFASKNQQQQHASRKRRRAAGLKTVGLIDGDDNDGNSFDAQKDNISGQTRKRRRENERSADAAMTINAMSDV